MPVEREILRISLRCDESAPGIARRALGELDDVDPVREDALLVVSELVTNAVLHSEAESGDQLELVASVHAGRLRIAVTDPGRSESDPAPVRSEPSGNGGYGLRMLDAIAPRWGSERAGGMRVWAELTTRQPGSADYRR